MKKAISFLATFAVLFNSIGAPLTVLAQEVTPSPTPEVTSTPLDLPTPTDQPTISPTDSATPTVTPDATPAIVITPTPDATASATDLVTPIPTDQPIVTQSPESNPTTQGPPPSDQPSSTPTATPAVTTENGHLSAVVLDNTKVDTSSLNQFDLTYQTDGSATISTDKLDYSPTDSVFISGTGFIANKTYTININSSDEPAVNFTDSVKANDKGEILYTYQLDGNYRPNYAVYVKSGETVVASTTFTDSKTATIAFSGNGSGSITGTGFNCTDTAGADSGACVRSLNNGDTISLTASATSGSTIGTWSYGSLTRNSGCTSGSTSCNLTMGNSNATITLTISDSVAPTAAITYSKNPVKSGNSLTITATFSEAMTDSPKPKIAVSGANTVSATNMTKTDTTHYFYTYTVGAGNGTATVTLSTGKDLAGNVITSTPTSGGTFTVDNTAPTIAPHGDEPPAEATGPTGAVVTYSSPATSDNVDAAGTATCLPSSGSTFALGDTTVTCNATDSAGNSATPTTFVVRVVDTTAPVLTLPSDITDEATGPGGNVESFSPTASDLVDGSTEVSCSPLSGSTFELGTTPVNCSSTDSFGNTAIGSFNVTVQDTTGPVIDAHGDETAEATDSSGALVTYESPATTDNVDGSGTATCLPPSGSVFELGNTTVTCNATDSNGNGATPTTFKVIVQDTVSPVITVLGDDPITVEINSTYEDPGSTAIDSIDGDISDQVVVNDSNVDTSTVGTYTVYFDVQDASGNGADQKTRTVNVVDTIANTFVAISNDLYDNYSINTNLDQVNSNNVNNFSSLYFEKQDENWAPFGRITFNNPLDLTDSSTQSFLQSLGSYLDMNQGRIALDARNSEMFAATGATLEVYYMPEVSESNLIVRDDLGNVLNNEEVVSNFNYDSDSETATFDAAHFTQFDFDTTAPDMSSLDPTIDPLNNSYTKGNATVSAHVSDDVSGVDSVNFTIKDSGENSASCSGVQDGEDSTLWSCQVDTTDLPDSNGDSYDMVIVATDAVGNSSSEEHYGILKSYFDIDNTAPTTPVADPEGKDDYTSDQSVSLSSSDERSGLDKIFYTTDGSTPDNTKTEYSDSDPILVDKDMTIKAIAYDNAGNASSIMTETYGIAPVISGETSGSVSDTTTTITWTTDDPSTSRVVYDTVSHLILGSAPNYGYAFSTIEDPAKVTSHSVGLTGLTPETIYYYRTISHGSPETLSDEGTLTTSATPTTTNSTGGGGTLSAASAPSCSDTKPGSAPVLTRAVAGINSVTLFWTAASDPVSYYLVTYGANPGSQTYGNPNVGDRGTTSYTVSGLSGGSAYYFRLRAGNGCMPGDFSNEVSATPTGGVVAGPAAGFAPGVLGTETQVPASESSSEQTLGAETSTTEKAGVLEWISTHKKIALGVVLALIVISYLILKKKKS